MPTTLTRDDVLRVVKTLAVSDYLVHGGRIVGGHDGLESLAETAYEELRAQALVAAIRDGAGAALLERMTLIAAHATAVTFAVSDKDSEGIEDFAREQAEIIYDAASCQIIELLSAARGHGDSEGAFTGVEVSLAKRMVDEDINERAQQLVERQAHEAGVEPL